MTDKLLKKCLIISGGDFSELPEAFIEEFGSGREYAESDPGRVKPGTLVIACDRGYEYAERLGIKPDLIVGDFDSSPEPDTQIPIVELPTRKDDTDTMKAARIALERGYGDLVFCCALGGRMDHAFANIQTGAFAALNGGKARIVSADTEMLVLPPGQFVLPEKKGWSLSLFSMGDSVKGLSIEGCKYSGNGLSLGCSFPLGASNVWASSEARISFESGILLVIMS